MADVAADQLARAIARAPASRFFWPRSEHRRRSIDADHRRARFRHRNRDPAGAAAEFEDAGRRVDVPVAARSRIGPERDVASADGLRVFPVVVVGVVVPAFVPPLGVARTLIRHRQFAGHDRPRARQQSEPRPVADERQDADEDHQLERRRRWCCAGTTST